MSPSVVKGDALWNGSQLAVTLSPELAHVFMQFTSWIALSVKAFPFLDQDFWQAARLLKVCVAIGLAI